ncbi:MAG: response regulator [Chloroflexota bacterium]
MVNHDMNARFETGNLPRVITVLYVEDNKVNAELMTRRLRRENIVVMTAENGKAGIESAMRHVPDLILMDFNLPDINGIEVMRRLQKQEDTASIPVVMVTSSTDVAVRHEAYDAGCRGYLLKPLITVELKMMIERLMQSSSAAV